MSPSSSPRSTAGSPARNPKPNPKPAAPDNKVPCNVCNLKFDRRGLASHKRSKRHKEREAALAAHEESGGEENGAGLDSETVRSETEHSLSERGQGTHVGVEDHLGRGAGRKRGGGKGGSPLEEKIGVDEEKPKSEVKEVQTEVRTEVKAEVKTEVQTEVQTEAQMETETETEWETETEMETEMEMRLEEIY